MKLMNVTKSHMVGACMGMVLWFAVGWTFGGWFWLPFVVMCIPLLFVVPGFLYGLVSGTGGLNSIDDAVSKGLEYRDDYNPEEEYDHE